jgi:hypothetical protein
VNVVKGLALAIGFFLLVVALAFRVVGVARPILMLLHLVSLVSLLLGLALGLIERTKT